MPWRSIPQGGNGDEMVNEIKKILADDVKNGLPAELIEAARRHEIVDAEFQRNSVSGLAMEWSEARRRRGPANRPTRIFKPLPKLSAADVGRVARQYLNLEEAITAVLTPQASGKPISSSAFGGQESLASTADSRGGASRLGGEGAQPPGGAGIQRASGGHNIAQRSEADCPAGIGEQHGQRLGPDQKQSQHSRRRRARRAWAVFSTSSLNMERPPSIGWRFRRRSMTLARKSLPGRAFPCRFCPTSSTAACSFWRKTNLIPALPEDAFKIVQRRLAAAVAGQLESPDFLTHQALNSALFPKDDPSLRHATPATVSASDLAGRQGLLPAGFPAGSGHHRGDR